MLLLVLASADLTPLQVVNLFAKAGYPIVNRAKDNGSGEIVRGKARIWMGMEQGRVNVGKQTIVHVTGLRLQMEFASHERIDDEASERWTDSLAQSSGVKFQPHLGNTVTEVMNVSTEKGLTPAMVKASVDAFLGIGGTYAKVFRATYAALPAAAPRKMPFAESTRLFRADLISFRRAAQGWGWAVESVNGYASQGWMQPILVSGKKLWIRQATSETTALDRSIEIVRYDDAVAPADYWSKATAGGGDLPTVIYDAKGMHAVAAREPIDLARGVSLGDLRRRILDFAARQP